MHFYAPNEISAKKKELARVAGSSVASLDFVSDRRSSVQRSASEAEVDDILHLFEPQFEAMDNIGLLQKVKFAALSLDRLPKYAPEDTNICAQSLIDRLALKLLLRIYPPELSRCAVMLVSCHT